MASSHGGGGRFPLRAGSAIALLLALLVTAAGAWSTHVVVRDQEHRLLKERTSEVGLVLTSAISNIPAALDGQGGILQATHGSKAAYQAAAQRAVTAGPGKLTFAWLRPQPGGGGYVVLAAAGTGLHAGEVISDSRTRTFAAAAHSAQFVATPVFGAVRTLGFAIGPPTAPAGTVLYRESVLGPLSPPRAAATAPFAELDVALYSTPTARPSQILTSTDQQLPLRGDVRDQPLAAGASHWLLAVKAKRPLVGGVAANAAWLVLGGGLLGSLLIAVAIETAARRRDAALALYATEHQMAETLQRSLLPRLPAIRGLELAAQYLAGGVGQEIGGDWFDAFPLRSGSVGIAVGDVIGHDLAAASAMSQIRSALRAYALDGDEPDVVMNRLSRLIETLDVTQLVTVFYGVLEPAAADGSRLLRYTNAGHLPPLLRSPDGHVSTLTGGDSVIMGAPISLPHAKAERRLEPGTVLLLFTDGLVEVPGSSLEITLAQLAAMLGAGQPDAGVGAMCERIVASVADRERRDDIALLAVEILGSGSVPREPVASHVGGDPAGS